jgi:hypothetical protein
MPNPLWVTFPPLNINARTLWMDRLTDFLAVHRMEPFHVMPLAREDDDLVILDGEGVATNDLSQMLEVSEGRLGACFAFHVGDISHYFQFILRDQPMPATLCLEIPREILAVDSDTLGKAAWVVSFISDLANHLKCACTLSSRSSAVSDVYPALDVEDTLAQLRSGRIFDAATPVILTLRHDLISAAELASLFEARIDTGFHLDDDGDYHVLWSLEGATVTETVVLQPSIE